MASTTCTARRVVITGMGAVSAAGVGFETLWNTLLEGRTCIHPIERVAEGVVNVTLAAELSDFNPEEHGLSKKEARRLDLFSQYALVAAAEAVEQAGINFEEEDTTRCGVFVGTGMGGLESLCKSVEGFVEKGTQRGISPLLATVMEPNMAGANIALKYGLRGENFSIATACASGTHSIGEACRSIRHGYADVMLAGGAEMVLNGLGLSAFAVISALSKETDPACASIPFDARRSGFVMGEGAGVLVLESLEHALERGATILAEVAGFGHTCDAHHLTAPDPTAEGPARAMRQALAEAGREAVELDYLNAHGTSTHLNDLTESRALHLVCGEHTPEVLVHSIKGNIGHSIGAAGALEAAVTVRCIQEGRIPGTFGYAEPDPECNVTVTAEVTERPIALALSTSLGFGGHNAALALVPFEG